MRIYPNLCLISLEYFSPESKTPTYFVTHVLTQHLQKSQQMTQSIKTDFLNMEMFHFTGHIRDKLCILRRGIVNVLIQVHNSVYHSITNTSNCHSKQYSPLTFNEFNHIGLTQFLIMAFGRVGQTNPVCIQKFRPLICYAPH